jgi:hypothetical protein
MLGRADFRFMSLLCAMLYFIVGVYGTSKGIDQRGRVGSVRKHITSKLLAAVSSGYPPRPVRPSVAGVLPGEFRARGVIGGFGR